MKTPRIQSFLRAVLLALSLLLPGVPCANADLPRIDGVEAIASVNGEPITLDELLQQVAAAHSGMAEPQERVKGADPSALLDRLINVRLILQEAYNIGLDELPEIPRRLEAMRLDLIRDAVVEEVTRDMTPGDPQEVERLFRDAVREAVVESVLLPSEDAATAFLASVEAAAEFGTEASAMLIKEEALAYQAPESLPVAKMQPQAARVLLELEPGQISAPITLESGVTVVRLIEFRFPENPEARARAEQEALERRQQLALGEYAIELRERYATVDEALLESLKYDEPGTDLEALREDGRAIARIKGGDPITVGELTSRMEKQMFHGLERAAEQGRVEETTPVVLDRLIQERAVAVEARNLGIADRPEFERALQGAEDGLMFGTFVSRVIDPKVKLSDEELQAFLAEHQEDYSKPEMMGLESLAFRQRENAQAALEKLRQGADLKWMRANATGQVDPETVDPGWRFQGQLLPVSGLPEPVREAVVGAKGGDYRFCEQPGGDAFHVLWVTRQFASTPQEYDDVREQLSVRVFAQKRQLLLEDWMARLREASEIEVYAEVGELRQLLGLGSAEGR